MKPVFEHRSNPSQVDLHKLNLTIPFPEEKKIKNEHLAEHFPETYGQEKYRAEGCLLEEWPSTENLEQVMEEGRMPDYKILYTGPREHVYYLDAMIVEVMTEIMGRTILDDLVLSVRPLTRWGISKHTKAKIVQQSAPAFAQKISYDLDDLSRFFAKFYKFGSLKAYSQRKAYALYVLDRAKKFPGAHNLDEASVNKLLTILLDREESSTFKQAFRHLVGFISGNREDDPSPSGANFGMTGRRYDGFLSSGQIVEENVRYRADIAKEKRKTVASFNFLQR